uniref:WW domain binding protein VOPP1 n=1 Tax=Castor canadensis TaxID=51338 RepID=A0A8B7URL1_CASCN|nr:vesicular, overexpressed in cancer, prosurvival protein 1 isoform X1 [Castor canadensis]
MEMASRSYSVADWDMNGTCRSYEDCCGSRCCVRALSIQRLWYFWFLLMMGVLFCCGAGFFIRRRMYPPPLIEEPAFNVSYTRQPPNPTPGQPAPVPVSPPCHVVSSANTCNRHCSRVCYTRENSDHFIHSNSNGQLHYSFILITNAVYTGLYAHHLVLLHCY